MSDVELRGIDNVLFAVSELQPAVAFYETCGLRLKFRVEQAGMALFAIGDEEPGLLIRRSPQVGGGRLWVEVKSADEVAAHLAAAGIGTTRIETMTGITVEATDPSGNIIGFADYSKRPGMARK
jgi:catechol 2,3-dioxygenase-like lactoylglutathione lyase family enzyme